MSKTQKILEKLATNLFHPLVPSPLFLASLSKFLSPMPSPPLPLDSLLRDQNNNAFLLSKKLPNSPAIHKLLYVFLSISTPRQLSVNLRQGALGFETSHFNPVSLPPLRLNLNAAIFSILQSTYSHGLLYRQLKIELNHPSSLTHLYFLQKISPLLREYENAVLLAPPDFLPFYCAMYSSFRSIKKLASLSDAFKSREYLKCFKSGSLHNPVNFSGTLHIHNATLFTPDPLFNGYYNVPYKILNECSISYILNGTFNDPFSEFFIHDHVLDYGLIPPFISRYTAETVAYIGKYSAFLRSISSVKINPNIQRLIEGMDLSKNSANNKLKDVIINLNTLLYSEFFIKYRIFDLLNFIHSTFLFGRIDFIEKLFSFLKESRKVGRKNICTLLENALCTTFPDSPFNRLMDIYIPQDGNSDSFSLYIKLEYPASLFIEEEFIIKLVYVFQYLWKIKRIEHLSARLGELKYFNIIQKMEFYVFNEVIGTFSIEFSGMETLAFEDFKHNINKKLDEIMHKLFMQTKERKVEKMLGEMEEYLVKKGVEGFGDDKKVERALIEFAEAYKGELVNTYLFNLWDCIKG